jgi:azurin
LSSGLRTAAADPAPPPPKPETFAFTLGPLDASAHPTAAAPRNKFRLYDFYAKQADAFRGKRPLPALVQEFPGLDAGKFGHWGTIGEGYPNDRRWNTMDCGSMISGVVRAGGKVLPKGIFVTVGDFGVCFDPVRCAVVHAWKGGKWTFSDVRHGFMEGPTAAGDPAVPAAPAPTPPVAPKYRGLYRHGTRVIFSYHSQGTDYLECWEQQGGSLTALREKRGEGGLAKFLGGGAANWPQKLETRGVVGRGSPFVVDVLTLPESNPWNSLLFVGDHDFFPNGDAAVCTMCGDVWVVSGIDAGLERLTWKRFAAGLHQPLGLRVIDGKVHVLGKDQITRLHDLNGDGEADFYECVTNAYQSSPGGHDYIAGLEYDGAGNFFCVSQNQGVIRVPADGSAVEVLAGGLRNPDGLTRLPDGVILTSSQEGDWTPSSLVVEVKSGGHYGYHGPIAGRGPDNLGYDPPLVYLPRGVDNSPGAFAAVQGGGWKPLAGQVLGTSFGACGMYLVLREKIDGLSQGAVVPLPVEFESGVHRLRFSPRDGQLYVSGMDGWGTYAVKDGCFQRVRLTESSVQLPVEWHARDNGVMVRFLQPVDRSVAGQASQHFAQQWNYRYAQSYGSPEFSVRHPGEVGHDVLEVTSATVLADGRTVFFEIPQIVPSHALHLSVAVNPGARQEIHATVHRLGFAFTDFPGYRAVAKNFVPSGPVISPWSKGEPNPWAGGMPGREVVVKAGTGLKFESGSFSVKARERISLTFENPDVVPHNIAIVKPGTLQKMGEGTDRMISDPDGPRRQYVPKSEDVIAYVDITDAGKKSVIHFTVPAQKGEYPFLCTFPGHWRTMNGIMRVE